MTDTIMWFLDVAWKILGLVLGWMILKFILRNGKETIRDILETLHLGMQALGIKARLLLREYLGKEKEKKDESGEEKKDESEPVVEMSYDKWKEFQEFEKAMKEHRPFVLK